MQASDGRVDSWSDYWAYRTAEGRSDGGTVYRPEIAASGPAAYKDDRNNFGPAIGFSWSLPWFGKDKTTIRGGYGISYFGTAGRGSAIDTSIGQGPGTLDQITYTSSNYLDLSRITLPLPRDKPGFTIPLTQRTQSIDGWDPNFVSPYVQSINFSITREVKKEHHGRPPLRRYEGNQTVRTIPLNEPTS